MKLSNTNDLEPHLHVERRIVADKATQEALASLEMIVRH